MNTAKAADTAPKRAITLSESSRDGRFYHPELDGLRFFAFFAVFFHHGLPHVGSAWAKLGLPGEVANLTGAAMLSGGYGVDFFFALSSYLITELLIREHLKFGKIDFKRFFIRRSLRIWPLYYVFLGFALVVVPLFMPQSPLELRQIVSFGIFLANWEVAFYGYPASVIAPLWSIAIEEQFYIVWPTVVRLVTPQRLIVALIAMFAVAIAARIYLVSAGSEHPGIWCNTLARLDPIAAGALLAVVLRGRVPLMSTTLRWTLALTSVLVIVLVTRVVPIDAVPSSWNLVWSYLVVSLAVTMILFVTLVPQSSKRRGLSGPLLVYLGRISYALYVFHVFGLKLAEQLLAGIGSTVVRFGGTFALGFIITVVCSVASYHLLEKPFLRLKTRFARVESRPE